VTGLHAEWTKLRTSPGTMWLLLAVVVTTVAVSVLAVADCGCVDQIKVSLTGVQLGQAAVAILAVLSVGGEYGTGMVRVSLAAIPRRAALLAAKAAVVTGVVSVTAIVAVLASLAAAQLVVSGDLLTDSVLRPAAGSVLYLVLIGLLSLGVATAVRNSAAAIGIVLGLLYVLPIVALAFRDEDWQRHLQQVGPMSAGLAIQATVGLDDLPIGPWAGLGVLAAWAAGALLTGGALLAVRDA